MLVREFMSRDVLMARPDMPIVEAARIMRDADVGFLPVCDDNRLVGTVTDRDIVVRCLAVVEDTAAACVRDAMTADIVFCLEDEEHHVAATLMGRMQVRRLPVLDRQHRLVGIVSLGDIADGTNDDVVAGQALQDIAEKPPVPKVEAAPVEAG
ncbi:CBS domain-containing protein [Zavarzinia sp. CC-PAN008]|uniref:CBS domain-containing protein n=1 Tax=Zavarzinia sp. CC-PAN008 TaxID=3243332 RepID=UPI003F74829B